MDDVYAINVAKSQFREGFNTGRSWTSCSRCSHPRFTDMSDGRPSRYGEDAGEKLGALLADLFSRNTKRRSMSSLLPSRYSGNTGFDHGWHELTLTPKSGGEAIYRRTRYLEVWTKQDDRRLADFVIYG